MKQLLQGIIAFIAGGLGGVLAVIGFFDCFEQKPPPGHSIHYIERR